MAVNQAYLAENVRRAAGAHLVPLDGLARYIGVSRPAIMKLTQHRSEGRSLPSAGTMLKLSEAFGVDARHLVSEPGECLRAVAEAFERAPIREAASAPEDVIPFTRRDMEDLERRGIVVRGKTAGLKPTTERGPYLREVPKGKTTKGGTRRTK